LEVLFPSGTSARTSCPHTVHLAELHDDGSALFAVRVEGWQQLGGNARKTFIEMVSDHCALYCEVE